MGLTVKAGSEGSFVPVPAGLHLARCYQIIDLGTQKSEYIPGAIKSSILVRKKANIWARQSTSPR